VCVYVCECAVCVSVLRLFGTILIKTLDNYTQQSRKHCGRERKEEREGERRVWELKVRVRCKSLEHGNCNSSASVVCSSSAKRFPHATNRNARPKHPHTHTYRQRVTHTHIHSCRHIQSKIETGQDGAVATGSQHITPTNTQSETHSHKHTPTHTPTHTIHNRLHTIN